MISASQKRNIKNRLYRKRKQLRDFIQGLPRELRDQILAYSPIPEEILRERDLDILEKMPSTLRNVDIKTAYDILLKKKFSNLITETWHYSYVQKYYRCNKYDSFYTTEFYDFWKNHLKDYYKLFSHNEYIRKNLIEHILDILKSNQNNQQILRKQLIAIKIDLQI